MCSTIANFSYQVEVRISLWLWIMSELANLIQLKLEVGFRLDLYISYNNIMSKCQMVLVELTLPVRKSSNLVLVEFMLCA